jgi:hypothetical protein
LSFVPSANRTPPRAAATALQRHFDLEGERASRRDESVRSPLCFDPSGRPPPRGRPQRSRARAHAPTGRPIRLVHRAGGATLVRLAAGRTGAKRSVDVDRRSLISALTELARAASIDVLIKDKASIDKLEIDPRTSTLDRRADFKDKPTSLAELLPWRSGRPGRATPSQARGRKVSESRVDQNQDRSPVDFDPMPRMV